MTSRSYSIRSGLTLIWVAFVISAVALALLMLVIFRQGSTAQIERTLAEVAENCAAMSARLAAFRFQNGDAVPGARDLALITQLALYDQAGIEGGFWRPDDGFVGYAYPSYEGGLKKSLPTETDRISALAAEALQENRSVSDVSQGLREAVIIVACPTALPDRWAIWTMTRHPLQPGHVMYELLTGLLVLLLFVVGSGIWVLRLSLRWRNGVEVTEAAVADVDARVQPTGIVEVDRLVEALNLRSDRLAVVQAERMHLAEDASRNARLTALGRMAAGIAHETRNPIAAMLLRAENAIAGPPDRAQDALHSIIEQVRRLERMIDDLLAYTHQTMAASQRVDIIAFLSQRGEEWRERLEVAELPAIELRMPTGPVNVGIDPEQARRMVDNLIGNAVRHSPAGGQIALSVTLENDQVRIDVTDEGPGIDPVLRDSIFEAFVSGTASGTGLGLAIAREIATAHGGNIALIPSQSGAHFRITLPCMS